MTLGYEIYNTGHPDKDYAILFASDDLEGNKEMLMYRKYAVGLLMHRQCGYIINIRAGGTKDFADDFLCIENGKAVPTSLSSTFDDRTPESTFANHDPRMSQTFLALGKQTEILNPNNLGTKKFPRLGDMGSWPSATGYHLIKY